jgi:hypothetical protein
MLLQTQLVRQNRANACVCPDSRRGQTGLVDDCPCRDRIPLMTARRVFGLIGALLVRVAPVAGGSVLPGDHNTNLAVLTRFGAPSRGQRGGHHCGFQFICKEPTMCHGISFGIAWLFTTAALPSEQAATGPSESRPATQAQSSTADEPSETIVHLRRARHRAGLRRPPSATPERRSGLFW